jgi:hypothetical protein
MAHLLPPIKKGQFRDKKGVHVVASFDMRANDFVL